MKVESPLTNGRMVWNLKARTLHWGLALCVLFNFINDGDGSRDLHLVVGYVAFTLVFLRVCYGFFGSRQSVNRSKFFSWPINRQDYVEYFMSEFRRNPKKYDGHNPMACFVYALIWTCIALLSFSGFMMGLDRFWGEEWLEELHGYFSNALLGLLMLHFIGLVKDAMTFRRKTWMRMFHGRDV